MFDKAFSPALLPLSHISSVLMFLTSHSAVWLCHCHSSCLSVCMIPLFLTWANFWAGAATFQCSDTVVFVFVFAIPVCLDPCDPVDCGNSVPPCHSEPVWRNDLVSRTQTEQRNCHVVSDYRCTCRHKCVLAVVVLFIQAFKVWIMQQQVTRLNN